MTWLVVLLAVLIGVALGLLGGGGSILAVPLLVYVGGLDAKEAIATSLLVVGVTSAVAAVGHARAGRVRWGTGAVFGAAAMGGAYVGGRLAAYVPGTWLLVGFALMMIATAAAMVRGRRGPAAEAPREQLPVGKVLVEGLVVGLVTGMVGAGGGFLVVPALVLLGGLSMPVAVGTSLVVITMKSFAGLAGYLASVQIDWGLAAAVTTAAVAGSLVGSRLTGRVSPEALRRAFGWFVLAMGTLVLGQQLPGEVGRGLATSPVVWGGVAVVAGAAGLVVALRRRRPTGETGPVAVGDTSPEVARAEADEPEADEPGADEPGAAEPEAPQAEPRGSASRR